MGKVLQFPELPASRATVLRDELCIVIILPVIRMPPIERRAAMRTPIFKPAATAARLPAVEWTS
jgi:hypothetical protein